MTEENISKMDKRDLIKSVLYSFDLDSVERIQVQAFIQARADEVEAKTIVRQMLSEYKKAEKKSMQSYGQIERYEPAIPLVRDKNDLPEQTIDNLLMVMRLDPVYEKIRYNLLKNAPEVQTENGVRAWSDTDDAESQRYIEKTYNIYNRDKHKAALRLLFREREYHPIRDIVDALEWDGTPRITKFLAKWTKAEDCPYTSEVSRLIFAGGINRLYLPGCKFDDVPVLIGTNQGEGKSTIVKWLAIHDSYYSEVTEIEGQRGIEALDGAWICEIAELLALSKTKEQEAVKAYITRQRDKYRKPWDINPSEYPRQCLFVGTTNLEHFLKDKTGNRRWYPIKVQSNGYWLYDHERECRDYILQCWAEAKALYDAGTLLPYADKSLTAQYQAAQNEAMEDDWRVGAIEAYLSKKSKGDLVYVRLIKRDALCESSAYPKDPTPKESQEIAVLMNRFTSWNKAGLVRTKDDGPQRCWVKTDDFQELDGSDGELPF